MDLLALLLDRRGELVSRSEIALHVWGPDLFVEAEAGINTAVRKVRQALQESPEMPNYVETVSGKGYRFIGEVQRPPITTLAVLPVVAFEPNPDQQYLADGLTEEVIAAIGQVDPNRIRVIGRTSVMKFQGSSASLKEIGEALGAAFLVESSIRTDSVTSRIVSRLIRTQDQVQVWCESFEGQQGSSVISLQQKLSLAIAAQISSQIPAARLDGIEARHPKSNAAYDCYLRGRFLWHRLSAETTRGAIEHYRRAASLDPDYGLAWAGLAIALAAAPITGDVPSLNVWPAARDAASQALRSAPQLAEALTASAFVTFWLEWDLPMAAKAFQTAIAIDPSDSLAHRTLGVVLAYLQRHTEAAAAAVTACTLDPLNAGHYALKSQIEFFGRDFRLSLESAQHATDLDREFWVGHLQLAQAAEQLAQPQLALEALERASAFSAGNSKVLALRAYILARNGDRKQAEETLKHLKKLSEQRFIPPYSQALIHLGLEQFHDAMACLEDALAVRDVHLNFLLVDAKWDAIREQVEFKNLIQRCKFFPVEDSGQGLERAH